MFRTNQTTEDDRLMFGKIKLELIGLTHFIWLFSQLSYCLQKCGEHFEERNRIK